MDDLPELAEPVPQPEDEVPAAERQTEPAAPQLGLF